MAPRAFITGCAGSVLTREERSFLQEAQPWGLILFARNCDHPDQIRSLVAEFRDCVGRGDAPVLIDQEGGRVQRLKPPRWPQYPPAAAIRALHARDAERGMRAGWLSGRLIGEDLHALGITVNCLPVLDLDVPGADAIIGDRSYGAEPDTVVALASAAAEGLAASGVAPIAKHIPGHGRATADSHLELPTVDAGLDVLRGSDFETFRRCSGLPMAMTAHILYTAADPDLPATLSPRIVADIIREEIGFGGLLMTDDLSMKALSGSVGESARGAFAAGCDIALHCNGEMAEMAEVAGASPELSGRAAERAANAVAFSRRERADIAALRSEFADIMGGAVA